MTTTTPVPAHQARPASDDHAVLELPDFELERGETLRPARLAYRTHGELSADGDNAILFPTWFAGTHRDNEWLIGPGRPLDTDRWFVIVPNLFGNGLSSSPSNAAPPHDRAGFPAVTVRDNVRAQHALVTETLGVERLQLVIGCSMGALQAYQWAVSHPAMVRRALPFCGAPRTSPHNRVFIAGLRAALTADAAWRGGWYDTPPRLGLRAFARIYAGWGFSQAFYRDEVYRELGFASLEDVMRGFWEAGLGAYDANDLLAMLWTWEHADVGTTPGCDGDTGAALARIAARVLSLPAATDLYFTAEDERLAIGHVRDGSVREIPTVYGHLSGGGLDPAAAGFVGDAVRELLADA